MTSDPNDPTKAYEYPSLENSPPPVDPYAPVDYPTYPPAPSPRYTPPGYTPFPPPYTGYGTDPYDPYRGAQAQGANGQAIGALISALVGLLPCFCGIPSIVAVVLGVLAMNETKRTGQEGHALALAAVIIGGITLALGVVWIIFIMLTPTTGNS